MKKIDNNQEKSVMKKADSNQKTKRMAITLALLTAISSGAMTVTPVAAAGYTGSQLAIENVLEAEQEAEQENEEFEEVVLPTAPTEEKGKKKDIGSIMNDFMQDEFEAFRPDVVYTDSVCFWGKLNAWKYDVPMVVSTSTFAFNQMSSGYMKNSPREIADLLGCELHIYEDYGHAVYDEAPDYKERILEFFHKA